MKKMPKYKVGDVAALFSTPKEPTSEAGKKLQSLFKQFHSKNKDYAPSHQKTKKENHVEKRSEENQNQSMSKKKKRKFDVVTSPESNIEDSNAKKCKMATEQVDANSPRKNGKKKNKSLVEQNFPRKKKSKIFGASEVNYSGFNELEVKTKDKSKGKTNVSGFIKKSKKQKLATVNGTGEILNIDTWSNEEGFDNDASFNNQIEELTKKSAKNIEQGSGATFKTKNKSEGKKHSSGFIKKSKQQKLATVNGTGEILHTDIMSKEEASDSDASFKDEIKELLEKSAKKLKRRYNEDFVMNAKKLKKKKGNDDNFVSSSQFNTVVNDSTKSQVNKEYEKTSNKQSFNNSGTSFRNEVKDFVRSTKKLKEKNSSNNFIGNSQPRIFEGELDFVKIPGIKSEDEEEKLSRTLFIGNLPVKTKKKALKTLFSPFGEIQQFRHHGVETDKAKIFSEGGTKSLNPNNYAADSIPGYIVFKERQSAVSALSLSGSLFKDRHITVDFALPSGTKRLYDDKRSVFIGNLPFGCQDESVWEAFSECGRIEGVRIVRDKQTGIGKGFGYVQFSTVEAKEKALALDLKIEGRSIRIKEIASNKAAQKKDNTPPVKRDTFKSHAIRLKKKNKESGSRKTVNKIMKKQKHLHKKMKIASIIQSAMKS